MSKNTQYLKDISKTTNEKPDEFIATAGELKKGSELLAGLKIGVYHETKFRQPAVRHNYIDVVSDMRIDNTYSSFYNSDKTQNQRFTSFSEAVKKYNELVLEKAESPEVAEQYLINNVPEQATELSEDYLRGEGYRAPLELCTILHSQQSLENPEQYTALLHNNGKFAILENIEKDEKGRLNFKDQKSPRFEIESIQEILDEYVARTKCEVAYGKEENKESDKIVPNKEFMEQFTGDRVDITGVKEQAMELRELTKEKEVSNEIGDK